MINGIILASGLSKRFGQNKLKQLINDKYVIEYIVNAVLRSNIDTLTLVYSAPFIHTLYEHNSRVKLVYNPLSSNGQSEAIKLGVASVTSGDYMFFVGDQPLLTHDTVNKILCFYKDNEYDIVAPKFDGVKGNPVIFTERLRPSLLGLSGDNGGKILFANASNAVGFISINGTSEGFDIDKPEDFESVCYLISGKME